MSALHGCKIRALFRYSRVVSAKIVLSFFFFSYDMACGCRQGSNIDIFTVDDKKWCCRTTNETCNIVDGIEDYYLNCTGQAISLQEQCPSNELSHVCNHYPDDRFRNFYEHTTLHNFDFERSFLNICNDGR